MSKAAKYDDIDLMQYADGELDESTAGKIAAHLEADEDAARKAESLAQMTDTVRSYLELSADDAEPRLDAMWATIERRIQANGESPAPVESAALAAPVETAAPAARQGILAAIGRWFESYRSHFMTGAMAAAAAALLIMALRPTKEVIIERPVAVHTPATPAAPVVQNNGNQPTELRLAKEDPSPPEIELLDVNGGTGTVFVMPKEGEDDVSATVIFVDMNNDVEEPL